MSSFSSKCFNSFLDSLWDLPGFNIFVPFGFWFEPCADSFCELILKNVGVPSIVLTIGFSRPPRSNSCAEIFLTGVVAPEPPLDEPGCVLQCVGEDISDEFELFVGVACDTNQASTTCLVAFLKQQKDNISIYILEYIYRCGLPYKIILYKFCILI